MNVGDLVRVKRSPERVGVVRDVRSARDGTRFAQVSFELELWPVDELEPVIDDAPTER